MHSNALSAAFIGSRRHEWSSEAKTRILVVVPYFHPARGFGGPVEVAGSFGRELVKRGHEVVVFTSDAMDGANRVEVRRDRIWGMEVYYFQNLSMSFVKSTNLFLTHGLLKRMKLDVQSFDIVHSHEYTTYQNILVHAFAKKYKVPYLVQAHGSLPRIGKQLRKWAYDVLFGFRLLRDASGVIALSKAETQQYMSMGVRKEKVAIVPNGIDLSRYTDLPSEGDFKKKFSIDDGEEIVLYLGRVHRSKGLDLLAAAFRNVMKELDVRLVIAGPDDGYLLELSRLCATLGIDEKVLFTGFLNERDKLAALVDGGVFVTPRYHGFPITFLEACCAGCPIVTTSPELSWIQDNVGYVVPDSPVDLSRSISIILQDKALRAKMRDNCIHYVQNFEISKVVARLECIYEHTIGHNSECGVIQNDTPALISIVN
jgi:glycosyltransferase involved in cell wall biosynthesis